MRSRTELVTTTFIDSEEDPTESDDSEEDWRPSQSAKRRPAKPTKTRRKKRKLSISSQKTLKENFLRQQQAFSLANDKDFFAPRQSSAAEQKFLLDQLTADNKNISGRNEPFELFMYKKDLDENYKENSHLCLWRRDNMNLLQKYIRVKTTNPEEFIFTSSSVYSSWDEKRRKDFVTITVKQMEENNRRVTLYNPSELVDLVNDAIARKNGSLDDNNSQTFGNESSNNDGNSYGFDNEEGDDEDDDDDDDDEDDDDDDDDDDSYDESTDDENDQTDQQYDDNDAQNLQSDNSDSNNQ